MLFPNTSTVLASHNGIGEANMTRNSDTQPRIVGMATGIPMGVALVAAIVVLLWQWRALRAMKKQIDGQSNDTRMFDTWIPGRYQTLSPDAKGLQAAGIELSVDQTLSETPHDVRRQELEAHRGGF